MVKGNTLRQFCPRVKTSGYKIERPLSP